MCARHRRRRSATWLLFAVAAVGVLAALSLPFAPVQVDSTTLTWPAPGQPVASSTAQIVPYRPTDLAAHVPCTAIAAGLARPGPVTVLATAPDAEGLVLRTQDGELRMLPGDRALPVTGSGAGCAVDIRAGPSGIAVGGATPAAAFDAPVPKLFAFRTALPPGDALGMSVTAQVDTRFATRPTGIKTALIVVALLSAVVALYLLHGLAPWRTTPRKRPRRSWPAAAVDVAVVATLCAWSVVGPLAVDDGWAATIARHVADSGHAGNYYRWWDASESPFAFSQQLLAPLTSVSLAPLWLRLPSTALAVLTWFVLSRGLLGAALPTVAHTVRVRSIAGVALLAAWLPFNLGTRPESYVAFGLLVVAALLWRARRPATLGWTVLAAALTVPMSPSAVMLAAPAAVFAPRAAAGLRCAAGTRARFAALVALLTCVGAVALVVVFADQTLDTVLTATRWHTVFGPSLPWYDEPERYRYLLGDGQQGSAAKRVPVLVVLALVPPVVALAVRRRRTDATARAALRMAAVLVPALLLLAFTPSKWSYHLGAAAGLLAAFSTIGVVLLLHLVSVRIGSAGRVIALGGGGLAAAAAALAYSGSNGWWLPALYDVPWASSPARPFGIALDSWWLWAVMLVLAVLLWSRRRGGAAVGSAAIGVIAMGLSVVLLMASFLVAPVRRPQGSLALVNAHRVTGGPQCGLADDIEVLADGAPLPVVGSDSVVTGFDAQAGFDPDAPPPDAVGTGMATFVWGSRGPARTGALISPWFGLAPATSVAISVNGRTDGSNSVVLEFGRADGDVAPLGRPVTPQGPVFGEDNSLLPAWRTVGVDAATVPAGADRVRVRAVDGADDPDGWLAVTGPRQRSVERLTEFLAGRSPVLVSWPMGFVFPCVRDIPRMTAGVVEVPRVVLKAPGTWFTEPTDQAIGGSFAALVPYGRFYEVPSRLVGHPDVDWGAVLVSADVTAHDTYRRATTTVTQWGHQVTG